MKRSTRDHGKDVLDIRREALKVFGYSIRYGFSEQNQSLEGVCAARPRDLPQGEGAYVGVLCLGFLPRSIEAIGARVLHGFLISLTSRCSSNCVSISDKR